MIADALIKSLLVYSVTVHDVSVLVLTVVARLHTYADKSKKSLWYKWYYL